jgi:hypothetical protein
MSDPLLALKNLQAPEPSEVARERAQTRLRQAAVKSNSARSRRRFGKARSRRLLVLVPATLLAGVATAMALSGGKPNLNPADPDSGVGCFTDSGGSGGYITKPDPARPDPIATCRREWRAARRDSPGSKFAFLDRVRRGPLVGCVNETGAMYVFPGHSVEACIDAASEMGGERAYPLPENMSGR